jgi:hypothetical protein
MFLKNTTSRKLDLFPYSGNMMPASTLLSCLERAGPPLFYMKMETDPVSEMLCFLKKNIKPWTKSKNIIFSSASVHLRQNPLN